MAGKGSTLRFTVEVAADQATQALTAISAAANQAGVQMRTALTGIAPAARQAGESVGGLGNTIKAFARDQRSEARAAGFFVGEIAQIIPISAEAKTALTGLGGAFIGGAGLASGIGIVVAAVGFLASAFRSAAEEAAKFGTDAAKAIDDLDKRITTLRKAPGATKALEEWQLIRLQVDERRALIAELERQKEAEFEAVRAGQQRPEDAARARADHDRRIRRAQDEIYQLDRRAERIREVAREELKAVTETGAAEAHKERLEQFERENQLIPQIDAHVQTYYRHLEEMARKERAAVLAQSQGMTGFEEEGARMPEYQRLKADDFEKGQDAYNKRLRESIALNQQWGEAIGGAIGELMTGQATAAQVAARIGQLIIQSVVRTAIASITAKAAEAGAGAAASQAGIPVVGPALAIGAMGAMISAVLALIGSLPSARGGWWNTGSYEGLMQIHRGETVLAQPDAEEYRAGVSGRRAMNVTVVAMDSRDVGRALRDSGSEVSSALRKLQRSRRG